VFTIPTATFRLHQEVRCVAEATGGMFVRAEEADALGEQLVHTAGQDIPRHCR
jgi:hypothetical protein